MNKSIETLRQPRIYMLDLIKELDTDALNKVPDGFNNNIIWNLGHMTASQQGICYRRAGLTMKIDESLFLTYQPGTKPEKYVAADEVETIKQLLFTMLDQLETDFDSHIFGAYTKFTTRYGVELASIDDAIAFLPFHDGFHIGYIMALKRAMAATS